MTDGQLSLLDVPVGLGVSQCEMAACRICTGCAHSSHGAGAVVTASDTPLTSDNDTETCENRNGRRGAGNTTDGLTHHSPLTRRRAVVSVSPDTQNQSVPEPSDADTELVDRMVREHLDVADVDGLSDAFVNAVYEAIASVHARYEALEQAWKARAARIRRDLPPAGEVPADVRSAWALEAGAWGLAAVEVNDLRNGTLR